jgi:hypothetical protein
MPWLINSIKFLIFLPVLIYFYSIHVYATNIPFSDDYIHYLDQIISIIQVDTLSEKFAVLFSNSLQTLLLFNKISILLIYSIWGEINLKIFIFIGNSALLGSLFFLYKTLPENREKIFLVFPVVLILFQLKPNWIHLASGLNLGYHFGLLSTGLTFYLLEKKQTKYVFIAGIFAANSLLTTGSGVVTLATGWLILIIQKRFRLALAWFFTTLIILFTFFFWSNLTDDSLSIPSLNDLTDVGVFFISFLGAAFSFKSQAVIFIFGTLIVFYFIFLIYKKYYLTNLTIFSFMVYIILVAAMVALYRSELGAGAVFADRYKIFSLFMSALIYISIVDLVYSGLNRKWIFLVCMIMITGLIYFVSYAEGKNKLAFSKYLLVWRTNQWLDQNFNLMAHPFEHLSNPIMTRALTSGYYKLPYKLINIPDNRFSPLVNSADLCSKEDKMAFRSDFNVIAFGPEISPFLVRIEGVIYDKKLILPAKAEPVNVILDSLEGRYIFTAHTQEYIEKSIHFRQGTPNKGLLALIPFRKLKDNIYRLGLCYKGRVVFNNHFIIKQNHQFKHIIK